MISINGSVTSEETFNWLLDSGFRYGYGCFETMLFKDNTVPLFDYHYARLIESLSTMGIAYSISQDTLLHRIHDLVNALQLSEPELICRIYVSGGSISLVPNFQSSCNEIISIQPVQRTPLPNQFEFMNVTPNEFYRLKSMNYAHHIMALKESHSWPIYLDGTLIFAVGIVREKMLIYAKHDYQLPSVSRQFILDQYSSIANHEPLTRSDFDTATTVFGSNSIRGLFVIHGDQTALTDIIGQSIDFI